MKTKHPPSFYLPMLDAVLDEELGLFVTVETVEDQRNLVQSLWAAMKIDNTKYNDLIIFQPQPVGTIFVAKKTVELDP